MKNNKPHRLENVFQKYERAGNAIGRYVWMPEHVHLFISIHNSKSHAEKWAYVQMKPARASLVEPLEDCKYQGELCAL